METRTLSVTFGLLLIFFNACQQEENPYPATGSVSFSLSQLIETNGKVSKASPPAYVVLSIGRNGVIKENIKLSLFDFGQGYVSESLELEAGNHQLVDFVVFDEKGKPIYASPLEGSELAEYVDDPLPIDFSVRKEKTQIAPQLLAYLNGPIESVGLDIALIYPAPIAFDSAYILFKNDSSEIKYNLTLDNSSFKASGHMDAIPSGEWKISTSYFQSILPNYKSLESVGTTDLTITPTATHLISTENTVFIKDESDQVDPQSFQWQEYYYYQLYSGSQVEGFARLPKDPTNPFVEITTFQSKWTYAFSSRLFYNSSNDGSSNYHQGSCAFEVYGRYGDTHDRLEKRIVDTTSLNPGILKLTGKTWNFVTGVIILYDHEGNELLLYYEWDLRIPVSG